LAEFRTPCPATLSNARRLCESSAPQSTSRAKLSGALLRAAHARIGAEAQSAFEVGRNVIRNDESHFPHFKNWRVAEHDGRFVGAGNEYVIPEPSGPTGPGVEVARPLNELKNIAALNPAITSPRANSRCSPVPVGAANGCRRRRRGSCRKATKPGRP